MNFIAWAYSMVIIYTILFLSAHPVVVNGIIHRVLNIGFDDKTENFLRFLSFIITGIFIVRLFCMTAYRANNMKQEDPKSINLKEKAKDVAKKTVLYSQAMFMVISDGKNCVSRNDVFCEKFGIFKHIL